MLQLTDAQGDALADDLAAAAGLILIDKSNPPPFAREILNTGFDVAGLVVQLATGGRTTARALKEDSAQTVFNLIFLPNWHGTTRLCAVRHELAHWRDWIKWGWNGAAADKVFQPAPVEYIVNRNGAAFMEGHGYGYQGELMVHALGATRDEMAAFLAWMRDAELPTYGLAPAQCADAASVADAIITGALAGAAPSADTQTVLDAMKRRGIATPHAPSAPSAR